MVPANGSGGEGRRDADRPGWEGGSGEGLKRRAAVKRKKGEELKGVEKDDVEGEERRGSEKRYENRKAGSKVQL